MRLRPVLFALILPSLAGCSSFPELDEQVEPAARQAGYPALLPLEMVLADSADAQISDRTAETLSARAAALRARAARLRQAAGI